MPGRRRQRRSEAWKIDATPPWEVTTRAQPDATTGPFDARDHPEDGIERVDLGALRIPVVDGVEVRLEVDEHSQVVAATLAGPHGTVQLGAFAAPRNEGIWDEVRAEIATGLRSGRAGSTKEQDGPFGRELVGAVPSDGGGQPVPVRFVGVDGPRWFLRAMYAGPVALDHELAADFEQVFRSVVVHRGTDPIPARDPIPLRLPHGVELPGPAAG